MKVVVNGETRTVRDGATLRDLLAELKLEGKPVAVERNREVVLRARYAETQLAESDILEIVHAVGGG